jgi:hypothetical protein
MAGGPVRYDNPMPELTSSYSHGSMNSATEDDQFACSTHLGFSRKSTCSKAEANHLVSKFDKTFRESVYKFKWPYTFKAQ